MIRIDHDTSEKIHKILMLCRSRGEDPVAVLDRAGLLRYPARLDQDRIETMDAVIESAEGLPVSIIEFWKLPRTATDAKEFIVNRLKAVREGMVRHAGSKKY